MNQDRDTRVPPSQLVRLLAGGRVELNLLGLISATAYGLLSWQSRGVEPVALPFFYLLMGVVWAAVARGFFILRKGGEEVSPKSFLTIILIWATLFRVAGILASPILAEDDFFRFLWDGYRFAETGDPYRGAPADFVDAGEVPEPMASLLYDINYPELPTIYGPVMEVVFLLGYLLEPASLLVLKCLFVLFDGLLLYLLSRFLNLRWFLVAAWCPLLIFEASFQAHPDIIGVSLMVAALWAAKQSCPWRAMLLLGLATCAKPFAVLLWPFLVQEKRWFRQGVMMAAVIGLIYLPFLIQSSDSGLTSLGAMATGWEFNSAGYALLSVTFGEWARVMSLGAFSAVYLWLLIRFWNQKRRGKLVEAPLDIVYGVLFLFSPVINAWYLLWLFPFALVKPRAWSLIALAAVGLSYATGLNLGDSELAEFEIPLWVRAVEFALIGGGVAYEVRRRLRGRLPVA